ncbi:hypothetical protein HRbin26_01567 [bacterium HR26]|nr:hypothetical protein HRbin26_01567 [bacterium HR26]
MAQRALKWSLLILILVEIVLVRAGWLSIGQAVAIVVLIEGALTLVAGIQAIRAVRRYRHQRAAGRGGVEAFEDALSLLMPQRLARLVALELRLWICLGRWLFRRYRPDERDFSYRKRSIVSALVVLVILTAPVEILILELLIPWAWLRWVLLALAVYGMIWVIGLYASLVVLPHRVADDGLWLRYGLLSEACIPFPEIADIQVAPRKVPDGRDGLRVVEEERAAYLAVGSRTDVTIALRRPQSFRTAFGRTAPVDTLHIAVDAPQRLCEAVRARLSLVAVRSGTEDSPHSER